MKKVFFLGSLLLALCAFSGCGANADSLVKQDIKAMNDLSEALENREPEAKVNELKTNLEEIKKKLEALKLSDDDKKRLIERHKDDMDKAMTRFVKARVAQGIPGMPEGFFEKLTVRYGSIAVLPFTGELMDPRNPGLLFPKEYLETELPDAVARAIAKIGPVDALKVIAPAVVREKREQKLDLRMLGQALGAKTLLVGKSMGRESDRIDFQLIVAQDGALLWADSLEARDVATKVAELVVQKLTGKK